MEPALQLIARMPKEKVTHMAAKKDAPVAIATVVAAVAVPVLVITNQINNKKMTEFSVIFLFNSNYANST
jgi:hypothetical protein